MYGALTGMSKLMVGQKHGQVQLKLWRRSYATRPPQVSSFSSAYPGNDDRWVGSRWCVCRICLHSAVYWENDFNSRWWFTFSFWFYVYFPFILLIVLVFLVTPWPLFTPFSLIATCSGSPSFLSCPLLSLTLSLFSSIQYCTSHSPIRSHPFHTYSFPVLLYICDMYRYVKHVKDIRVSLFESVIRSLSHLKVEVHRKFPKTESLRDCTYRTTLRTDAFDIIYMMMLIKLCMLSWTSLSSSWWWRVWVEDRIGTKDLFLRWSCRTHYPSQLYTARLKLLFDRSSQC